MKIIKQFPSRGYTAYAYPAMEKQIVLEQRAL